MLLILNNSFYVLYFKFYILIMHFLIHQWYFISFLIVSLVPFISNLDSSSNLTIFIIPYISSFEIINAIVPDPLFF